MLAVLRACAIVLVTMAALSGEAASADSVADFYQGKRITILVGAAPGPAYDLYARMLAGHIGKYIPGNPSFIVRNMPGAGGMVALNSLYNQGPQDGTALITLHIALPLEQALGNKAVHYDARKLIGIGRFAAGNTVTGAWHSAGVTSYKDLFEKQLVIGGGQASSNTVTFPTVAQKLFGLKLKIVAGYESMNEQLLAMERGEIQGLGSISLASLHDWKPEYFSQKLFIPLFQWGLAREPELPDIPAVGELGKNPVDRTAVELLAAQMDLGRSFFLPPGVPRERAAALRAAFDAMVADPDFLAEAKKTGTEVRYASGADMEAVIARVLNAPPPAIQRLGEALGDDAR
jgi:tripartite-type tricarboxylate transporter receptor subunit TctC